MRRSPDFSQSGFVAFQLDTVGTPYRVAQRIEAGADDIGGRQTRVILRFQRRETRDASLFRESRFQF